MRALGIDLGSKRIGVAVSDSDARVATPVTTLTRAGTRARDHAAIAGLVSEWEAQIVVVGLPLSLDGSVGPAARAVLEETNELAGTLPVPVDTIDERFTTVTAVERLEEQRVRGRRRAAVVDQAAAAILLQAWLDRRRSE